MREVPQTSDDSIFAGPVEPRGCIQDEQVIEKEDCECNYTRVNYCSSLWYNVFLC